MPEKNIYKKIIFNYLIYFLTNNLTNGSNVRTYSIMFSFKTGRVVLVTAGRFAGKKAIVARNYEDGTKVSGFTMNRNTDIHIYC